MRDITNKNLLNSLIATGLIASFVITMVSNILFSITIISVVEHGNVLKVAMVDTPDNIDPVDSWNYYHWIGTGSYSYTRTPTNTPESISNYILNQVVETLIAYDLSDPSFPLKGRLAESWDFQSTIFGTNITFQLRENVFFHDGSKFTGECVIHTIERINYFSNWTGTLPLTERQALSHSLYKFSDGKPIFNDSLSFVNPENNLEVTIILNAPYGPAEGLLAYTASAIVHPNSTLVNKMLNPSEDLLIGTGPFKMICFVPDSSIRLARWDRYWSTGPYWDDIIYVCYENTIIANNAMLSGDVDYLMNPLDSLMLDFEADPDVAVVGDDPLDYFNGPIYWFIGINSMALNRTWRKAICHAFNYSYLINNIEENKTARANSLVHPRLPGHNSSIQACTYNISYARTLMQSMGFGVGWEVGTMNGDQFIPGANEADWKNSLFTPADGHFTDGKLSFPYRSASHFMQLLTQRFIEDMDLIGIGVELQDCTWDQFIGIFKLNPERIHLFYSGWGSDYVEAFNTIDPLVNPLSDYNYALINDTEINDLLDQVKSEPNTTQRYQYYQKLQYIIHEKNYYHMPLMYDKIYYVHHTILRGFPYNPMRILYLYPTYRD